MKKFSLRSFLFVVGAFLSSLLLMSISSCDMQPSSDQLDNQQQEQTLKQLSQQLGVPKCPNGKEKRTLKWVYELRDDVKLITFVYSYSEVSGKYTFIGRAIGYPIPYSTQYTNPQKVTYSANRGYLIMPNADPNGLFSPASTDATWTLLIDENTGDAYPFYSEPKLTAVLRPLPDNICAVQCSDKLKKMFTEVPKVSEQ